MSTIWPLPKVTFQALTEIKETRPVALLTSEAAWNNLGHLLNLPLVVQAEPTQVEHELMNYLAENLPSQAEVVYAVGSDIPITAGKIVAATNNLPLVVIPQALDSDMIFESYATLTSEGLRTIKTTGPAHEVLIDWEIIKAAPPHERAVAIVDVIAIVTALLDWRYATQNNKNPEKEKYSTWAAGLAAGLAAQAIKITKALGEGNVEAMRMLVDMIMMSVQLASQLGHDRAQEGTEHYLYYSLENQKAYVPHAEGVGVGILLASALHGQDPTSLREALESAGVPLNRVRAGDIQLAVNDLPAFCLANNLPFGKAHDIDPLSNEVRNALEKAGLNVDSGWTPANAPTPMAGITPATDATNSLPPISPASYSFEESAASTNDI
jgi:glycerol dehydrogenase-like iron-containing ADH family enzyme